MTTVSCLFPVLGRPHRVAPLLESLCASVCDVQLVPLFLLSPDDPREKEAVMESGANFCQVSWPAGYADWARKINLGYKETHEPWLLLGADDLTFDYRWADEALRVAAETGKRVIGTNDMANPTTMRGIHSTHPLVARSYADELGTIDGPGQVVTEEYSHQGVDTELVETAIYRGEWAFATQSRVRHHHPIYDRTVPMDETYRKGQATSRQDAVLFQQRRPLWGVNPRRR